MSELVRPQIDLKEIPNIECEECKNQVFKEVTILKKVSRILTGTSNDNIIPFPTYSCAKCGHINEEFKIIGKED
jgi:uncharacterized Zn finger protein